MNGFFTMREVRAQTDLTYRQLDDLDRRGLLGPSITPADGRGTRRLYSQEDVAILRAVAALRRGGVGRGAFKSAVRQLQALGQNRSDGRRRFVVVVGSVATVADTVGMKRLLNNPTKVTIVLPVSLMDEGKP